MSRQDAETARSRIAQLSRALDRYTAQGSRAALESWEEPEAASAEATEEAEEKLRIELAIVRAALKTERQQAVDLKAEVERLTASVEAERQRLEALRADRDRWAARAELLALPIFQERDALAADEEALRRPRRAEFRDAA